MVRLSLELSLGPQTNRRFNITLSIGFLSLKWHDLPSLSRFKWSTSQ